MASVHVEKLQTIQKMFVRIVGMKMGYSFREIPVFDLKREHNLLFLLEQRRKHQLIFLFNLESLERKNFDIFSSRLIMVQATTG